MSDDLPDEFPDKIAPRPRRNDATFGATVCIPRPQHEALMAAANAILEEHGTASRYRSGCKCCKAVAALRAAGIQMEEQV